MLIIQVARSTIHLSSITLVTTIWMILVLALGPGLANAATVATGPTGEDQITITNNHRKENLRLNFLVVRVLPDGERERRLHYGHVTVIETTAIAENSSSSSSIRRTNENVHEIGDGRTMKEGRRIRLVRITDGRHFVQSIYDQNDRLKDCEYVRDDDAVTKFLAEMKSDFELARNLRRIHSARVHETDSLTTSTDVDDGKNKTILIDGDVTGGLLRLADYETQRRECKVLHQRVKREAKQKNNANRRSKREISLIYPGTNWCGVGSTSAGFNDLGLNTAADRCCRQHDHCPHIIEGFATKYNLFNYRFHTLSHCDCDERFRTCLKMVDNGASNLVGKLFFNVVQMKCFVLKSEKICTKRSWWGRCLKNSKRVTAHLKDVLPY